MSRFPYVSLRESQPDVFHYAIPFMHVHAAGMFFAYIQSVCEAAISGLQYLLRGIYNMSRL